MAKNYMNSAAMIEDFLLNNLEKFEMPAALKALPEEKRIALLLLGETEGAVTFGKVPQFNQKNLMQNAKDIGWIK